MSDALWKVPLEVGKPPEHIADVKMVYDRWPIPPRMVGDSPYWYPGGRVLDNGDKTVTSLIDTRDGNAIPLDILIAPYQHVVSGDIYGLSPDGKQFTTRVTTPDQPEERRLYFAPVSDLGAGRLLTDDNPVRWGADGTSYVRREEMPDGIRLTYYSVLDDQAQWIWDFKLAEPDKYFSLYGQDRFVRLQRRV